MAKADFGSAFLRAEDLIRDGKWGSVSYTIKERHLENTVRIRDGKELLDKECISFNETDQMMVMGKLNWRLIRYATGIESKAACIGRAITLYAAKGNWFGEPDCAAIRVRVPKGQVRPNIKRNILGQDLTGHKFKGDPPPALPAAVAAPEAAFATATRLIDECQGAEALRMLLMAWAGASPIAERAAQWLKILAIAYEKIQKESGNWPDTDALQGTMANIQDEAQGQP